MALSQNALRRWAWIHKWSSLITTAFLLLLCLTGLPLIFHEEIDALSAPALPQQAALPAQQPTLEAVIRDASARNPGTVPVYLSWELGKPLVYALLAPSVSSPPEQLRILPYDARSGTGLDAAPVDEGVMAFLLRLHADLFLGLPGQMLLGLVALLFLAALVSGVVVYAPFMRRLAFGTVRRQRSARVKWLDTHNLTGIVLAGWIGAVALTGFVLSMETPITMIWQADQLAELTAPYAGREPPQSLVPVDRAYAAALAAAPDSSASFIAWPGSMYSSNHHYMVALRGNTPLTERLVHVALVDAATGELTALRDSPWYVKAAFLSAPLHFGDYGGLLLKIIWALLDLIAIAVLATGLYLWWKKGGEVPA